MDKRVGLGVHKKKYLKRRKKQLLRKVVDYLKSDTFMYAPLIASPQSEFFPPGTVHSSAKVVELKKPMKEKKWFTEHAVEYLKSDVYMYAPLVVPPHSPLGFSNQHTLGLKETVKHTVYQNCCSTSASGK